MKDSDSFRLDEGSHLAGKEFGLFRAIVEPNAVIGIAAEEESRMRSSQSLDGCHPVKVSEMILWNGPIPADDMMKYRRRRDAHGEAQLGLHGLKQAIVIPAHDFGPVPAAAHHTQQHMTGGRAAGVNR